MLRLLEKWKGHSMKSLSTRSSDTPKIAGTAGSGFPSDDFIRAWLMKPLVIVFGIIYSYSSKELSSSVSDDERTLFPEPYSLDILWRPRCEANQLFLFESRNNLGTTFQKKPPKLKRLSRTFSLCLLGKSLQTLTPTTAVVSRDSWSERMQDHLSHTKNSDFFLCGRSVPVTLLLR